MSFEIQEDVLVKYTGDMEKVVIPDGIRQIKRRAFSDCSFFEEIVIPDSVQIFDYEAFRECGMESIVIPDSVTELGSGAFEGCWNLQNVVIGKGITELPSYLFRGCSKLTHIELPANLQKVGYRAFEECYSLKHVWVDGKEYHLRDEDAPKPVRLVYDSLEVIRSKILSDYENGLMDEFEYIDYEIAGDGYAY